MCHGVPTRPLALLAPATVDHEERAFLTEVAISAMKELQDERRQHEDEERVELAELAMSTIREMLDELQLRAQRCIFQRRVRGRSSSPCLTE